MNVQVRYKEGLESQACVNGLKEINGIAVTCRILEGEEENLFWEKLWANTNESGGKGKDKKREREEKI